MHFPKSRENEERVKLNCGGKFIGQFFFLKHVQNVYVPYVLCFKASPSYIVQSSSLL